MNNFKLIFYFRNISQRLWVYSVIGYQLNIYFDFYNLFLKAGVDGLYITKSMVLTMMHRK
jgi:hypothetical protein